MGSWGGWGAREGGMISTCISVLDELRLRELKL